MCWLAWMMMKIGDEDNDEDNENAMNYPWWFWWSCVSREVPDDRASDNDSGLKRKMTTRMLRIIPGGSEEAVFPERFLFDSIIT